MKKLMSAAGLAGLLMSGCALPTAPGGSGAATAAPSAANLSLEGQSRLLRSKIVKLKQEVRVFEGMLTDVERRAAMSQISLSSLPNTEAAPAASASAASNPDRLSVTVRAAPEGAPAPRPAGNPGPGMPQQR